jgi:hypothetical protein
MPLKEVFFVLYVIAKKRFAMAITRRNTAHPVPRLQKSLDAKTTITKRNGITRTD